MRAPRLRSQTLMAGVPVAVHANHGPATISTNVSTTSLRHTKELHSGCSTAPMRPTTTHFASGRDRGGDGPGGREDDTAEGGGAGESPTRSTSHCEGDEDADADRHASP